MQLCSFLFKSCVLLNHVLFRSRVRLIEKRVEETILPTESWYEKLLKTSTERPKFIFEVGYLPDNSPSINMHIFVKLFAILSNCVIYINFYQVEQPEDPHFLELAKNHGSIFGFHGSPPENFYSILSFGLRNLSGKEK